MNYFLVWGSGVWFSRPENKDFETRRSFGTIIGFSKLKMTYCVIDLEKHDVIDCRSVISIPNNFPFRDVWKIPASIIRYDYVNWPEPIPLEKISIDMEKMLLKSAPKEVENTLLNDLTKTQVMVKDGEQPTTLPVKIPNAGEVEVDKILNDNNVMSPISYNQSTFTSPMTNFGDDKFSELDYKHGTPEDSALPSDFNTERFIWQLNNF